jgi:hypothetical protein
MPNRGPSGQALPAEARFILACIADPDSAGPGPAHSLGAAELDWDELRRIANRHSIIPMLWRFVSGNQSAVPESFLEAVRADFLGNALRNLALTRELVRIAGAFDNADIPMIALKGPALALDACGSLSRRQFVDLDILIRPIDLPRAGQTLLAQGYSSKAFEPGSRGARFFLSYEDQFISQIDDKQLDVHWHLLPDYFPFTPDEGSIWSSAQPIDIEGATIRTLAPVDHLLFVIAHATKHGWATLAQVCDVAAILRSHPELDWEAVAAQARRYNCERMLMVGLTLAADLIGSCAGGELLSKARSNSSVGALAQSIAARIFGEPSELFHEFVVPFRSIERFRDRARYLTGLALKPTIVDWESMPLPPPLYWIYYAARPLRLLLQFGSSAISMSKLGASP